MKKVAERDHPASYEEKLARSVFLKIPANMHVMKHVGILCGLFQEKFNLPETSLSTLEYALTNIYRKKGWDLIRGTPPKTSNRFPLLSELQFEIRNLTENSPSSCPYVRLIDGSSSECSTIRKHYTKLGIELLEMVDAMVDLWEGKGS